MAIELQRQLGSGRWRLMRQDLPPTRQCRPCRRQAEADGGGLQCRGQLGRVVLLPGRMLLQLPGQRLQPDAQWLFGLIADEQRQLLVIDARAVCEILIVNTAVMPPVHHLRRLAIEPRQQQPPGGLQHRGQWQAKVA
ncbi:hypothetical protein D3C76_1463810 [compost metagenome]